MDSGYPLQTALSVLPVMIARYESRSFLNCLSIPVAQINRLFILCKMMSASDRRMTAA
jgi:hypothetical protein